MMSHVQAHSAQKNQESEQEMYVHTLSQKHVLMFLQNNMQNKQLKRCYIQITGTFQAWFERRTWGAGTTWHTWTSRPTKQRNQGWSVWSTGANGITWNARERWTEGLCVCAFMIIWVLNRPSCFYRFTSQGSKGEKGDPVSNIFFSFECFISFCALF